MSNVAAALLLLGELKADLDHHLNMEGEEVEVRTPQGWAEVRERIRKIEEELAS